MSKYLTKFAEIISIIFNPLLIGLVVLIIAITKSGMSSALETQWIIASFVANGLILGLIYWYLRNLGYIFDDSIDNKKIRHGRLILLLNVLAIVFLESLVIFFTKIYQPILAVFVGGLFTIIIGMIITNFWKISWHSSAITYFVSMFIFIFKWKIWPILILMVLIFWARIYLKRHTIWQLIGGVLLSLLVMYATFSFFALI